MKRLSALYLLLYLLLEWGFLANPAQAEIRYATDSFTVPVRSGASTGHKILRMVPSGTPLEILEAGDEGYTKVKTPERTVGWILTRYLMDQPPTRDQVTQLEERIAVLDSENQTLRSQAEVLETTRSDLARCGEELAGIRRTASQALTIEEDNLKLQQEAVTMREQLLQLEMENAALRDASSRNWFMAGGGIALGSLALGLVIPHIPWRRRRRWDQF
ncbi:MAG: TIGR04211 family SH3 domain-containing protein [Gammaproteobacteria bacterium]|nr:TIGR04211 family SH3 domain-containing protein [Gammaproteobacteria bacterium]MCP5195452.1 TIGR04211 family SH3 domain-containing protein [Gammaproteobacteria bacterium]